MPPGCLHTIAGAYFESDGKFKPDGSLGYTAVSDGEIAYAAGIFCEGEATSNVTATSDFATLTLNLKAMPEINFVSFSVMPLDFTSLSVVLSAATPAFSAGDLIKDQREYAMWYDGYGFYGHLTDIDPSTMYVIQVASDTVLEISGEVVSEATEIKLTTDWNYLPYLKQTDEDLTSAMPSFTWSEGDLIKDEDGNMATYSASEQAWVPDDSDPLTTLKVGKGYKLKVSTAGTVDWMLAPPPSSPPPSPRYCSKPNYWYGSDKISGSRMTAEECFEACSANPSCAGITLHFSGCHAPCNYEAMVPPQCAATEDPSDVTSRSINHICQMYTEAGMQGGAEHPGGFDQSFYKCDEGTIMGCESQQNSQEELATAEASTSQILALKAGANSVRFDSLPSGKSLGTVFGSGRSDMPDGSTLSDGTHFAEFRAGFWVGQLQELQEQTDYTLKVSSDGSLAVHGVLSVSTSSQQSESSQSESLQSESSQSTPSEAVLPADGAATQAIRLHSGSNTVSFDTLPSDKSLNTVLASANLPDGSTISNGEKFALFKGGFWVGQLKKLEEDKDYTIKVGTDSSISVSGATLSTGKAPAKSDW